MRPTANRSCLRNLGASLAPAARWLTTAALAVAATGSPGLACAAGADVTPAPPRLVTVHRDSTPMKCSVGAPFYAVRILRLGEVLRVDGEEGGWLRVEYLSGMLAFARATDVEVGDDGKTLRLLSPSRLAAVNEGDSHLGHWWSLLDRELPAGSALHVIEPVTGMNEVVQGYYVVAPAQARGYVKADAVRPPTAAEAAAYQGRTDLAALLPAQPAPAPGAVPAPATVATAPVGPPAPPAAPPPATEGIDALNARFKRATAARGEEAETLILEVIEAFQRKAQTLGQAAEDRRIRDEIALRLEALQLRLEILMAIRQFGSGAQVASGEGPR